LARQPGPWHEVAGGYFDRVDTQHVFRHQYFVFINPYRVDAGLND
jgi:hypothetical protein